jgi:hypothetical protein
MIGHVFIAVGFIGHLSSKLSENFIYVCVYLLFHYIWKAWENWGTGMTKKRIRFGRDLLTRVETRLFSKDQLKRIRASEQSRELEEEFGDWVVEDLMMERLRSTGVLQ